MPLLKGEENVSKNIRELMMSYKEKGKIGHSKHLSKSKAHEMAVAIAMRKARE